MTQTVSQFLREYKMVIDKLKYQILKDAEQNDLLPTALISKYDVTLERLMDVLKSLLDEGCLALTEGKWLRITEKGMLCSIKEIEDVNKTIYGNQNYLAEFFSRSGSIGVNEPYLPSSETCKKIMEGEKSKETRNEK